MWSGRETIRDLRPADAGSPAAPCESRTAPSLPEPGRAAPVGAAATRPPVPPPSGPAPAPPAVQPPEPDVGAPSARRWSVFAVVGIALLMMSVDQTIVATALGSLQRDLGAPLTWSGWTITVYSLGQIIAMPVAGRLSDQFGRKKTFLVAIVVFLLASLCCGLAGNIYLLIVFRAIQALGGGAFLPSAAGIVADHFGPDRDRALGMFSSIFPIGAIIGPALGGLIVSSLSWRMIFFVNIPVGLLLLVLGAVLIRETRARSAARVDVRGIALLTLLLLAGMYGITLLGSPSVGLTDPRFLVAEAIAAIALVLFLRHAGRFESPIVPMRLLRGRGFGIMNVINVLFGAAVLGFSALLPLYAELRFHLDPLAAGSLLSFRAIGMIATAGIAVALLRRAGHRPLIVGGVLALITGLVLLAVPPDGVSGYAWLALAAGITGLGMGVTAPSANNATLHLAPDQVAAITGLRGMFRQSGAIIAISITTAALARSSDPGLTQGYAFAAFAVLLLLALPLIFKIPRHNGSW